MRIRPASSARLASRAWPPAFRRNCSRGPTWQWLTGFRSRRLRISATSLSGAYDAPDGITFKNTFFLRQGCASESLHFHEMVHVIQWARLGVEKFLLAYGLGLLAHGYEQSPLEKTAYDLQRRFDSGTLPPDVVRVIETEADAVWKQAEPIVSGF